MGRARSQGVGTFNFGEEFCGISFGDERLNKRFVSVIESISRNPDSILKRTQKDWPSTMAAYRLLNNDKVGEEEILRAHREQTIARMSCYDRVLALQDTTTICFSGRDNIEGIGSTALGAFGRDGKGLLCHTTLAVTQNGVPLGILNQTLWSRGLDGPNERLRWLDGVKRSADGNFTQVIVVGDREIDGADIFATARREGVNFVTRAKSGMRKSGDHEDLSLVDLIKQRPPVGKKKLVLDTKKHSIRLSSVASKVYRRKVKLEIRFQPVQLRSSATKLVEPRPTKEERQVNAVLIEEPNPPKGFEKVSWLLFTDLEVNSLAQAEDVLNIYKTRWEIETFHKLMKSACKVEKAQLESADRLKKLITILSIVAWRLHVLTKLQRDEPDSPCTKILTTLEWHALYVAINKSRKFPDQPPSLREATLWIAKLGGFLGRKSDGEPGPLCLWQGWIKHIHYCEMYEAMDGE